MGAPYPDFYRPGYIISSFKSNRKAGGLFDVELPALAFKRYFFNMVVNTFIVYFAHPPFKVEWAFQL